MIIEIDNLRILDKNRNKAYHYNKPTTVYLIIDPIQYLERGFDNEK
ncbi:MAG: hypothetical protein K0R69_3437 [Clostridia bacterium]|jgi:hypothetical protein|nr:hypothetical protein [Clostridia bacterium]